MSYFHEIKIDSFQDNYKDFFTLFGGGTTLIEPVQKFNKATLGSGAVTYANERYTLSVGANLGDYAILQQAFNNPYFEGNKQMFDITSELFQPVAGYVKSYGYWDMLSTTVDFTKMDGV